MHFLYGRQVSAVFFLSHLIFDYNFHGNLCSQTDVFSATCSLTYASVCNRQLPKLPCIATVSNAADWEMFSTQATAIWEIFFWSQGSNQLHAVPYGHSASFNFLHYILSYQKKQTKTEWAKKLFTSCTLFSVRKRKAKHIPQVVQFAGKKRHVNKTWWLFAVLK